MYQPRKKLLLLASLLVASTVSSAVLAEGGSNAGPYLIRHTTMAPADVWMTIIADRNGTTEEHELKCWLPEGIDSESAVCPQLGISLPLDVQPRDEHTSFLGLDLSPLGAWAQASGVELQGVIEEEPPQRAEAGWVGGWLTGRWECQVEESDVQKCVQKCGGAASVSTDEYPAGTYKNPMSEPQCEVECTCASGKSVPPWIDPPEILPSPSTW